MAPHSQNVAYSDGGSQVLWEDGERAFRRGWRLDDEGKRRTVLRVAPAADQPSRSSLDRLTRTSVRPPVLFCLRARGLVPAYAVARQIDRDFRFLARH